MAWKGASPYMAAQLLGTQSLGILKSLWGVLAWVPLCAHLGCWLGCTLIGGGRMLPPPPPPAPASTSASRPGQKPGESELPLFSAGSQQPPKWAEALFRVVHRTVGPALSWPGQGHSCGQ